MYLGGAGGYVNSLSDGTGATGASDDIEVTSLCAGGQEGFIGRRTCRLCEASTTKTRDVDAPGVSRTASMYAGSSDVAASAGAFDADVGAGDEAVSGEESDIADRGGKDGRCMLERGVGHISEPGVYKYFP